MDPDVAATAGTVGVSAGAMIFAIWQGVKRLSSDVKHGFGRVEQRIEKELQRERERDTAQRAATQAYWMQVISAQNQTLSRIEANLPGAPVHRPNTSPPHEF